MTETQKRIEAYQKALPGIREKVAAVAMLLALSVIMLTSASFAWLTISRAPEVSQVATNVAANGNLEIALVNPEGTEPEESKVGDSAATKGQSVTAANITWGNLVNLSDESYGLHEIKLRPAVINETDLIGNPLKGALYDDGGRITKLSDAFRYTKWTNIDGDWVFDISDELGVRAISSVDQQPLPGTSREAAIYEAYKTATELNDEAETDYEALGSDKTIMSSLAAMMGTFMTASLNPSDANLSNPEVNTEDINNLIKLYEKFQKCMEKEAEAMAVLLNCHVKYVQEDLTAEPITGSDVLAMSEEKLKELGLQEVIGDNKRKNCKETKANSFDQFVNDYNTIVKDKQTLENVVENSTSLKWEDTGLNDIVNHLVDVATCTIGEGDQKQAIGSIGASDAASYLSGTQEARITNGILFRFEERTGGKLEAELEISATVKRDVLGVPLTVPATVKANVQTSYGTKDDYVDKDGKYITAGPIFKVDYEKDKNLALGNMQEIYKELSEDTYGFALDFWLRTNAVGSYLTLEGNVLADSHEEVAQTTDASGTSYDLYTLEKEMVDGEEKYEVTLELYTKDGKWYYAGTDTEVSLENGDTPNKKMNTITTIIGYEGENRVWEENSLLNTEQRINATTQGVGSCYIYYADTPEDQAQSLELLDAMKIAFVSGEGELLTTAYMDTENIFAQNGRVIVPLVLDESSSILVGNEIDNNGELKKIYGITALEQNVATRITAIVYLDGRRLTNDKVLSSAEIQGQLNIQFGSTMNIEPIDDEDLQLATRIISAEVETIEEGLSSGQKLKAKVSITVEGDNPTNMSAFFIRKLNDTQGSREGKMTFNYNEENGKWEASYIFTSPGNYILRTVEIDGQEYVINDQPDEIVIEGSEIVSISYKTIGGKGSILEGGRHFEYLGTEAKVSVGLELVLGSSDEMPGSVQGVFLPDEESGSVFVNFRYDGSKWVGETSFAKSGKYTMEYLIVDGDYMPVPTELVKTAELNLGMYAVVHTQSPTKFKYDDENMTEKQRLLEMQVKIKDNSGNEIENLTNSGSVIKLVYKSGFEETDADLHWNGSGYYTGKMPNIGAGIWSFSEVVVGEHTITRAETAPVFTIMAEDPPAYLNETTPDKQIKVDGTANFEIAFSNAKGSTAKAYISKVDGSFAGYSEPATAPSGSFKFYIPLDSNGSQAGTWKIERVEFWDVLKPDGETVYTERDPYVIDFSKLLVDGEFINIETSVISEVAPIFNGEKIRLEGNEFLDPYRKNVSEQFIKVNFGSLGEDVDKLSEVKLTLLHNGNTLKYGGYSSADISQVEIEIELEHKGNGIFEPKNDVEFLYAGKYTTESIEFKLSGHQFKFSGDADNPAANTKKLPNNAPEVEVYSIVPTVSITDCSDYGSSTKTSTSATVYFKATQSSSCSSITNYSQPHVTITLSGLGKATGASLQFAERNGGAVHLYISNGGTSLTDKYEWTKDGECKRWVGFYKSKSAQTDEKTPAGTLTANTLVFTYDGNSYSFVLGNIITINNPE